MEHTFTDDGDRYYGRNLGIVKLNSWMEPVEDDIPMIGRPLSVQSPPPRQWHPKNDSAGRLAALAPGAN